MKRFPEAFLRARLVALYLISLGAVSGSLLAWRPDRAFEPLPLLWPPVLLGAAAAAGAALHERFSGLGDRHVRVRVRSLTALAYGALLLVVTMGLLAGSRGAAEDGVAALRFLQPLFLLLAGFGRGHQGTLVNAFALTASSLLAGGPGAAASATLLGSLLPFFLTADHAVRMLSEFPVEEMPPAREVLGRGILPSLAVAAGLAVFFWLVPPGPYAPLRRSGAMSSLPADRLVGLLGNLVMVAVVSTAAFYLLLRFGGGGRGTSAAEPSAEIVPARRKAEPRSGAPYREPAPSPKEWRTRIVALYLRTGEQLAKWGLRRRPWQTPREFARTLAPAGPAAQLADLVSLARYGRDELTEADYDRAIRASRELLEHHRRRPG
jgi:hypothetical protein